MNMNKFEGVYAVLLTPFTTDGDIDKDCIKHEVDFLVQGGVQGIVALGSAGEMPYLTREARHDVISTVADCLAHRVKLIVGTGCFGTDATLSLTRYAKDAGADGALIALPTFFPLEFEDVRAHYAAIASQVDLPLLYYNYPDCTHLPLTSAEIAKIFEIPNVVGAKESVFNMNVVEELIQLCPHQSIFTGTSLSLFETLKANGAGVICPLVNLDPKLMVSIYTSMKEGKVAEARKLRNKIFDLSPLMVMAKAPMSVIKEAFRLLGHPIRSIVKSPLHQVTPAESEKVRDLLVKTGYLTPQSGS